MKHIISSILLGLLAVASGCASAPPLGEPIDDAAMRTALLAAWQRPDVEKALFRTLIRWGPRELSLTEVVKPAPKGGFSVAGISDIGNTLYAVRVDPNDEGRVLSKSLPFSDQWILTGPVAEVLVPWAGPEPTARLYRSPQGVRTLVDGNDGTTRVFVFDRRNTWREFRLFEGTRLVMRISLDWNSKPVPATMQVDNKAKHYHATRESVAPSQ